MRVETRGVATRPAPARPLILMKVRLSMVKVVGLNFLPDGHNPTSFVGVGSTGPGGSLFPPGIFAPACQNPRFLRHPPRPPAVQPRRSRLWWTLGAILAVLFGFTGWVAWQAQGLEERILAEIQPHLATDVHIEGLDVSLWGAWPDVEVRLRGVRIADALDPEADFLTLNRLDLTVACWPLLEDRLEVRSLQLSQGQINLRRASDGTDNWVFWKTDESSEVALPAWRIESLVLDEVVVEGSWASGREVTGWSTEVQDAQLSLASGVGGALEVGVWWNWCARTSALQRNHGWIKWAFRRR